MPVEDLAQYVLGAQDTTLEVKWNGEGEFNKAMVEQRLAAFDARSHRGAIDLGKNIFG